jgi:hypothetical protein
MIDQRKTKLKTPEGRQALQPSESPFRPSDNSHFVQSKTKLAIVIGASLFADQA